MTTLLHQAAAHGRVNEVRHLLAQGAAPNAPDQDLDTPLHLASDAGQAEAVKVLLEAGADPNARCRDGDTPLHRSLRNIAIAKMLFNPEQRCSRTLGEGHHSTPLPTSTYRQPSLSFWEKEQESTIKTTTVTPHCTMPPKGVTRQQR